MSNPRRPFPPVPSAPGQSLRGSSPPPHPQRIPGTTQRPPDFFPQPTGASPAPPGPEEPSVATVKQLIETIAIPRLSLTVEREAGKLSSRTVHYDGDVCRIGAHSSNDLVLADPAVSRFHCRLVLEDTGWRVRDWSSSNGTKLDGVRIRDADLVGDATLGLGDSIVRVRAVAPAEEELIPMVPAFGQLAGTSLPMRKLFGLLEKIARSDINVLIEGESGTGKELVANEIVQRSPRADRPFVVVDCGAIAPSLVESELFGHVRGSFTGADRDRVGAFEAADGGTVFLDEVGELALDLQPKLLRAIEAHEIRRVGDVRTRKVDVRVVSATNRDLEREVNRGRFREDLYFRLAVVSVHVPPLRERLDDLVILIRIFLQALGAPEEEHLFTPAVLAEMGCHDWPGNVRELRNYVERTLVLQKAGPTLRRSSTAPPAGVSAPFKIAKDAAVDAFERSYLAALLEAAGNNMSKAARIAGMDRMHLHRLVQKHGLRGGSSAGGAPPLAGPSSMPPPLR